MNSAPSRSTSWRPILAVMLAVTLWCVYQAVGTYRTGSDVRKPLIVMAIWLFFIGGWLLMLYFRARRMAENER